jgi:uncharacterized membrane protein
MMGAVELIVLLAALFIGSHFVLSWEPVRGAMVGAMGERLFRGLYSLIALVTFIPLVVVFARHKHAGTMLWNLRAVAPVRWLVWLMMLAAVVIFVASFITPNPATIGVPTGDGTPRGVLKLTRHPAFVAFSLFGFAHMLMNGWIGDLAFFATFPLLGLVGAWHQDRRKLREKDERYCRFFDQTSFMPGVALLSGRQRLSAADFPWLATTIGIAAFVLLVALHHRLFGGYPLS